jgi:RNA polymerase sigma-70 factor (ECF subfamily)
VAINRLRDDHRRSTRKERAHERLASSADRPASDPTAASAGVIGSGSETLELLSGLPRQQRLCIALYYIDDLSIGQIASALGISEGAVKFHLHQGRNQLRDRHEGHIS